MAKVLSGWVSTAAWSPHDECRLIPIDTPARPNPTCVETRFPQGSETAPGCFCPQRVSDGLNRSVDVGKRRKSVSLEVRRSHWPSDSAKGHSAFKEIIMKLKSELKQIEEELKLSSRHEVERDGDAEVFELSLDELSYVAGGVPQNIKIAC
jgi:hypothetical protein